MFAKQLRDEEMTYKQISSGAELGVPHLRHWHYSNGKWCVGHSIPSHGEIKLNFT